MLCGNWVDSQYEVRVLRTSALRLTAPETKRGTYVVGLCYDRNPGDKKTRAEKEKRALRMMRRQWPRIGPGADAANLARSITRLGAYLLMHVYETGQYYIILQAGRGQARLFPYIEWLSYSQLKTSCTANRCTAVKCQCALPRARVWVATLQRSVTPCMVLGRGCFSWSYEYSYVKMRGDPKWKDWAEQLK